MFDEAPQALVEICVLNINYNKFQYWGKLGNGEHLISSKSGKEGTMKIVYGYYYSFTRLWCVVIWEIYLNFVVKISKKQNKTGKWLCLLFCTCDFDWAVHENKK